MKKVLKITFKIVFPLVLLYIGYIVGYYSGGGGQVRSSKPEVPLITQINTIRQEKGLILLTPDPSLDKTAFIKASDMADKNYFEHDAPDGTKWSDFIKKNRPDSEYIGENIAECYATNQDTITGWIKSPTHYANIVKPEWTLYGTATVWDEDKSCFITVNHFSQK
jgi:uncharacterized protein YkwD